MSTSQLSLPLNSVQSSIALDEGKALSSAYARAPRLAYLQPDEIAYAVRKVRSLHPSAVSLQFAEANFVEPPKSALIDAVMSGKDVPRSVEVISMCVPTNETFIDVIPLPVNVQEVDGSSCCSGVLDEAKSQVLRDVQPSISQEEYLFVDSICHDYEPLRELIRARGLNPDYIVADAWCVPEFDPTERVCWPALYYRDPNTDDLPYSRPIDGIRMRISLTKREVKIFDASGFNKFPIPKHDDAESRTWLQPHELRTGLKPIVISQPDGPSFSVDKNNFLEWQKWSMQVGFTAKEGVVLTGICYEGRPILHRFSMVEMVVPYGDPRPPQCWKNAFDAGEDGLGRNANSLTLGCDCLGHIHYLDAHLVSDAGDVQTISRAVCMHEEDASIAWKHTDWRTGVPQVARNRKMVISFICTIANYEYAFYYNFFLDGNIEVDVKLTGVLNTAALSVDDQANPAGRRYGIKIGKESLFAPVHQHFFVARMDFAVDGVSNSVYEWNCEAMSEDDPENQPYYSGFFFTSTELRNELQARRHCASDKSRFWQVGNPNVRNKLGSIVSYRLNPKTVIRPYGNLDRAPCLKRAKFLEYQTYVTPWHPEERFPAGNFPNQSQIVDGLPQWTKRDRNISAADVVFWHIFGVTHCPRPEEWPIMPAEHCGFKLTPFGFFDHSPAMDIPISTHKGSVYAKGSAGLTVTDPGVVSDEGGNCCCADASAASPSCASIHSEEASSDDTTSAAGESQQSQLETPGEVDEDGFKSHTSTPASEEGEKLDGVETSAPSGVLNEAALQAR